MLGAPPQMWGWVVMNSALDECIENLSWIGMLLGPICILIICRIGDRKKGTVVNLLTVALSSLFLVLHLPAFAPII